MVRNIAIVLCLIIIVALVGNLWWLLYGVHHTPAVLVPVTQVSTLAWSTEEPLPAVPTLPSMPTATPTPAPVVQYRMLETIDLCSGSPIALVIHLPEGDLTSNWAAPICYQDGNNEKVEEIFAPAAGTVYSVHGETDTLVTEVHSGYWFNQPLFAANIESYFRVRPDRTTLYVAEGQAMVASLVGATADVCQIQDGSVLRLQAYDPTTGCPGQLVHLKVVAAALVEHDKVPSYITSMVSLRQWLIANKPGTGFDQLSIEDGWIVSTCLGQYNDQPMDGPSYAYNRLAIGFQVLEP
jgi:hypothetical protein